MEIRTDHERRQTGHTLTCAEAEKFRKRAVYVAHRLGFHHIAEDLAQEVLLAFAEGRRKSSTVDQVLIDAVRSRFGRPGSPGHAAKLSLENAFSIYDEDGSVSIEAAARESRDDLRDFERVVGLLRGDQDRELLRKVYVEGKLLREIGSERGVSESRISQLLSGAERRLLEAVVQRGEQVGIELEVRTCACGCGNTFKCLPGSEQKFRSLDCLEAITGTKATLTRAKRRRVVLDNEREEMTPNHSAPDLRDTEAEDEIEQDAGEDSEDHVDDTEEPGPDEIEEETDPSGSPSEGGKGRFSMLIPEAAEKFSVGHTKIRKWIKQGRLQTYQSTPRKTFIDPVDIGRILEGDDTHSEEIQARESSPKPVRESRTPPAAEPEGPRRKYTKRTKKRMAKAPRKVGPRRPRRRVEAPWRVYVAFAGAGMAVAAGLFIATHLR